MRAGAKPDDSTFAEIVRVKNFLLANVSELHKLAMKNGAEDFAGHIRVVNQLVKMKNSAFERFEFEA
jgi:hypothetical protein